MTWSWLCTRLVQDRKALCLSIVLENNDWACRPDLGAWQSTIKARTGIWASKDVLHECNHSHQSMQDPSSHAVATTAWYLEVKLFLSGVSPWGQMKGNLMACTQLRGMNTHVFWVGEWEHVGYKSSHNQGLVNYVPSSSSRCLGGERSLEHGIYPQGATAES